MDAYAPLHFSDLKAMALSPAHVHSRLTRPRETTRGMRVGTVVHHIILGQHAAGRKLIIYPKDARRGKDWEAFEAAHQGCDIVTQPEWDDGEQIAAGVARDPVARELLAGCEYELRLDWEDAGIKRTTYGLDALHRAKKYIVDLKVTTTAKPDRWMRLAVNMLYHAQMADYAEACRCNGIAVEECYLLGVEDSHPFAVTALRVTPPMLELGRQSIVIWTERFRACRENDHWPGYTQTIVDLETPPWMGDDDDA